MLLKFPLATIFFCLPMISLAADTGGNYAIWGVGQASCNQFEKAYEKDNFDNFKNYLMGYLTAHNTLMEETYNATAKYTLTDNLNWLNNYCDSNHFDGFERAIKQLISHLHKTRFKSQPGQSKGWGRVLNDTSSEP